MSIVNLFVFFIAIHAFYMTEAVTNWCSLSATDSTTPTPFQSILQFRGGLRSHLQTRTHIGIIATRNSISLPAALSSQLSLFANEEEILEVSDAEYLQTFANLVVKGFHNVSIQAENPRCLTNFPTPSDDLITRYVMETNTTLGDDKDGQLTLEAWILPSKVLDRWPHMMMDSKQEEALGPSILFRRVDVASLVREEASMQRMLRNKPTLWIGLPGIGKSMSTTVMLVRSLELMYKRQVQKAEVLVDGFDQVIYRMETNMFVFDWNKTTNNFEVHTASADEQKKIEGLLKGSNSNGRFFKRVLIVEMEETEIDPKANGLYSSSSTSIFDAVFKSFYKGGASFYLMEPPTRNEARMMYATIRAFDGEHIPEHINTFEKFDTILGEIGPVLRILFTRNACLYRTYLTEFETQAIHAFDAIGDVSISNVGRYFKFFAAPFIRRGVKLPEIGAQYEDEAKEYLNSLPEDVVSEELRYNKEIYEFRGLSDKCNLLLAQNVKNPKKLAFIKERDGSFHHILECIAGSVADTKNDVNNNHLKQTVNINTII